MGVGVGVEVVLRGKIVEGRLAVVVVVTVGVDTGGVGVAVGGSLLTEVLVSGGGGVPPVQVVPVGQHLRSPSTTAQ